MKHTTTFFLINLMGLTAFCSLAGCSTWNPYRPVIQQGNIVTPDNIGRLTQGMSKAQIQALLGSPITQDIFQSQRWDYVYYADKTGKSLSIRRLSLWFEDDKLSRWESEGLPATIPSPTSESLSSNSNTSLPAASLSHSSTKEK